MSGNRSFPGYPPRGDNVGFDIETATPEVKYPVHNVATTATITTIVAPFPDGGGKFIGPLWLIAGSVFSWTSSGNIALGPGTTLVAGRAYGFVYNHKNNNWYPANGDS